MNNGGNDHSRFLESYTMVRLALCLLCLPCLLRFPSSILGAIILGRRSGIRNLTRKATFNLEEIKCKWQSEPKAPVVLAKWNAVLLRFYPALG